MKKTVFFGLLVVVLAFGFIGCGDDNGNADPKTYSIFEEHPADLTEVNTGTNLSLADGQSGISTMSRTNAITAVNNRWIWTGTATQDELRAGLADGDPITLTSAELNLIINTLNSNGFVVFAKATSSTEAYVLVIVRN